jgi:hypothetical protein
MGERSFSKGDSAQHRLNPCGGIGFERNPFFLSQEMDLPERNGRQPEFVLQILQLGSDTRRKLIRFEHAPQKNMGIKK